MYGNGQTGMTVSKRQTAGLEAGVAGRRPAPRVAAAADSRLEWCAGWLWPRWSTAPCTARRVVRYNVSQKGRIMATTMVHVRVDEKTKQRAARALAGMGVSVSDAVRMLLVVAEKALPFDVRVPNATTVKALRAADK